VEKQNRTNGGERDRKRDETTADRKRRSLQGQQDVACLDGLLTVTRDPGPTQSQRTREIRNKTAKFEG